MNKIDLVKSLSGRTSLPEVTCRRVFDALLEAIGEELGNDGGIVIQGFGSFQPWHQNTRWGRNPRTGTACQIHSRISVKFKPGKFLLQRLNGK